MAYEQWNKRAKRSDTGLGDDPVPVGTRLPSDGALPAVPPRRLWASWCVKGLVLATALLALACQELDPDLATGSPPDAVRGSDPPPAATGGGGGGETPPPPDGGETAQLSCEATRAQARATLQAQCAYCHQAPDNARSVYATGQFNFILELDKITTLKSSVYAGMRYVAPANPNASLIYQRTVNGAMPPANITKRPSAADIAVLGRWISSCADGESGWPAPDHGASQDAGSGADVEIGPGCGAPGQRCCAANTCNGGGCCVGNLCRANGSTCAAPPAEPGAPAMVGLPGTCNSGSCQTAGGAACGKPSQACCDLMTCTGSQSACQTGMTTCSACGETGQSCCKPNSCLEGRVCINGGVGRIGTCALCGASGQACCGSGSAAQQTCDDGLTCTVVPSVGNFCAGGATDGGTGDR